MRVKVESVLPCNADLAWQELQTSRLLLEVIRPLAAVVAMPGERLPETWKAGEVVRCRCYLLGIVPLGPRKIFFERIDPATREIQSRESDALIRHWDHLAAIEPVDPGHCRFRDTIEIDAGLLTPLVWLYAYLFYSHRQRRWQTVARRLAKVAS